jgi:hypothetical protein
MYIKALLSAIRFITSFESAIKLSGLKMDFLVISQMTFCHECFIAPIGSTLKWPIRVRMNLQMSDHELDIVKTLPAFYMRTRIFFVCYLVVQKFFLLGVFYSLKVLF